MDIRRTLGRRASRCRTNQGSRRGHLVPRRGPFYRRETARWKCSGVEVNEAEAQAIKRARVSRIQRVLKRSENPLVPDHKLSGTGTGFVVTRDGAVLTNHHVIDGCDVVTVSPVNASETVAYLGPSEPRMDLAVVVAKGLDRKPAAFRRNYTLTEGEPLSVVGYPLHGKVLIKPRVVTGSVREPIPRQPPGSSR